MKHALIILSAACMLAACNSAKDIDEPDVPDAPDAALAEIEVIAYDPAPGQFINELPVATASDTDASIREKVRKALSEGRTVSLGAWGGSVTLKLTVPIENTTGADFKILGNAFIRATDANGAPYGSCEPGIVEVMCDDNGNGLPDDTWFELRGDAHDRSQASLTVTYYPPAPDATDAQYIRWEASDGSTGWINRIVSQHKQPFFPLWKNTSGTIVKTGRRLPDNGRFNPATQQYDLYNISGYADAFPDDDSRSALDISDAIDADDNPVQLQRIHFIRVTTGVLQTNGPLGECSTEIAGVIPL